MKQKIWVLEDDPSAQFVYKEILSSEYELVVFSNMPEFLAKFTDTNADRPALLIADLKIADADFSEFLKQYGKRLDQPFLVVSSVDEAHVVNDCFEGGCLDFISKPFGKGELLAKISRILAQGTLVPARDIKMDPRTMTIQSGGQESPHLTSKEFQIVAHLIDDANATLPRQVIIDRVWFNLRVSPKTFDVHLVNLRRKLNTIGLDIRYVPPGLYQLLRDRV